MKKIIILLLITSLSFAQNKITSHLLNNDGKFSGMIHRIDTFPANFITPRTVDIWLPNDYSSNKKYSVIYMHDGQMLFDATTTWNKQEWMIDEVATKLVSENKINDVIVVAIWNIPNERHLDLFPKKPIELLSKEQQDLVEVEAKQLGYKLKLTDINSDNYLKFIVNDVKPFIDKNYSVFTDAKHTAIMGSSMGGLISMYAICEYPEIFGNAACLSTHWIGLREFKDNPIPESFFSYMMKKLPSSKNHKIYFDYGTETLDAFYIQYANRVDEVLTSKGYTSKNYRNLKFEGEDHSEASWQKRINIPFEFLFSK